MMELEALKRLLPAQLKELAYQFGLPQEFISPNLSQVEFAITLLTYAKAQNKLPQLIKIYEQIQQDTSKNNIYSSIPHQPYFFGRDEELKIIADTLDPESRGWGILIDGVGGIGKTELAKRAGHLANHFQRKIFLSAKHRQLTVQGEEKLEDFKLPNFVALITELAKELGDAGIARLPENERAGEVKRALQGELTLIIIDNLETFEKTEQNRLYQFLDWLPANCKAIVTSRRRKDISAKTLRLDRLDTDSALKLIEKISEINKVLG